jgi:hypothetical protein
MRSTRTITASLAAVLGAAALAGPAAAGQQGANDSAKANVYVAPAAAYKADPANDSAKANVYIPPNPHPINRHVPAGSASPSSASPSGFDWGSAGLGAAGAIGASLIALGGAAGLRRRRQIQPAATG